MSRTFDWHTHTLAHSLHSRGELYALIRVNFICTHKIYEMYIATYIHTYIRKYGITYFSSFAFVFNQGKTPTTKNHK